MHIVSLTICMNFQSLFIRRRKKKKKKKKKKEKNTISLLSAELVLRVVKVNLMKCKCHIYS